MLPLRFIGSVSEFRLRNVSGDTAEHLRRTLDGATLVVPAQMAADMMENIFG